MSEQPSDQPRTANETSGDEPARSLLDIVRDLVRQDELGEFMRTQLAAITPGKAARRELLAVIRYAVNLEAQAVEMQENGRALKQTVQGTTLTPDQDALEMDATIPRYSDPPSDE